MKKAPHVSRRSSARGQGDDYTYYEKSIRIVRVIQGLYILFWLMMATLAVAVFVGIVRAAVEAMA